MNFDELAHELDKAYTIGYGDRENALRDFGFKHEMDLRTICESGRTLVELAKQAKLGAEGHWANFIREGMGIAYNNRKQDPLPR